MKYFATTERLIAASPFCHLSFFALLLLLCANAPQAAAQKKYLGIGFHLTPPIYLEHSRNANVVVRPRAGIGGSITFKKEWSHRERQKWYMETGLTVQGLRYYQVNYHGYQDSSGIWSDFPNQHTGFPSILLGGGRSFGVGNRGAFSVGLEGSLLIVQDLDAIGSANFGIFNDPMRHQTFPLFLRLSLAYNHDLRLFGSVLGQLQVYTNLNAQKLTKGSLYIRNRDNGNYKEGAYHVNNSELGVKLFACLNEKAQKNLSSAAALQNAILAQKERKVKYRISITSQLYAPPQTVYHIPQVDSFSVYGRRFLLSNAQIGLTAEFPFRKHGLGATVIGLGIGNRNATMRFRSDGRFPSDKNPVNFEQHISIGHYLIGNIGISRRHALGRRTLSHTLSASVVLPTEKEYEYLGVPLDFNNNGNQLPPYENPILEGWIDYGLGRAPILFGIEYNSEIVFKFRHRTFMALGLVANYSGREVIAHGTFEVRNQKTTYYGAMLQRFSKLGVTLRVGFEK